MGSTIQRKKNYFFSTKEPNENDGSTEPQQREDKYTVPNILHIVFDFELL